MTRTGKIARLPREVRDELNQRLQDGESARRLVEWLQSVWILIRSSGPKARGVKLKRD